MKGLLALLMPLLALGVAILFDHWRGKHQREWLRELYKLQRARRAQGEKICLHKK